MKGFLLLMAGLLIGATCGEHYAVSRRFQDTLGPTDGTYTILISYDTRMEGAWRRCKAPWSITDRSVPGGEAWTFRDAQDAQRFVDELTAVLEQRSRAWPK